MFLKINKSSTSQKLEACFKMPFCTSWHKTTHFRSEFVVNEMNKDNKSAPTFANFEVIELRYLNIFQTKFLACSRHILKNRLPFENMGLLHATKCLDVQLIQPFFF